MAVVRPDTDSDNDGTPDCNDDCPNDPNKTEPGDCGCGTPDIDSDNDGTPDCNDDCPDDPNKTEPGACGCGNPDVDTDDDGVFDCDDNCVFVPNPGQEDSDGDGVGDACPAAELRIGTQKGSLLIMSKVEIRWDAQGNLLQDTFIALTNDYMEDVRVQMFFVNGDEPIPAGDQERAHPGWNWVDNEITLTGNEPAYWSALTGNPKGVSPFTILDPGVLPGRP